MKDLDRGGKRKGSGRKKGKTFKEPTGMITVRVPESIYNELREKFGSNLPEMIRQFLIKENNKSI